MSAAPADTTPAAEAAAAAVARLLREVQQQPWAHDFFALMRQIDVLRPHAPRTGMAQRPGQEALRLAQQPEMDFAPAPLASLSEREALGLPPRLAVRFYGLLGPHGPMPLHLTEYVRERLHQHGDTAPAHFLDLFHHRLLSLFYRAWAQHQPVVQADRPGDDRFLAWLLAAAGLPVPPGSATQPPTDASSPSPTALAFHAGLLAARSRHPEALCKVLHHQLGVPVAVHPHVGHWLAIERDDHSRLGHARNRPARALLPTAQLGRAANAGSRVWDRQYQFVLQLGPLTLPQYQALLPGGRAFSALCSWMRQLANPAQRWQLALQLATDARPAPQLGQRPRLGVSTWLGRPQPPAVPPPAQPAPAPAAARRRPSAAGLRLRPGLSFLQRRTGA